MRGRGLGKTGSAFAEYVEDFCGPKTTQMPAVQQSGMTRAGSSFDRGIRIDVRPVACSFDRLDSGGTTCRSLSTVRSQPPAPEGSGDIPAQPTWQ